MFPESQCTLLQEEDDDISLLVYKFPLQFRYGILDKRKLLVVSVFLSKTSTNDVEKYDDK